MIYAIFIILTIFQTNHNSILIRQIHLFKKLIRVYSRYSLRIVLKYSHKLVIKATIKADNFRAMPAFQVSFIHFFTWGALGLGCHMGRVAVIAELWLLYLNWLPDIASTNLIWDIGILDLLDVVTFACKSWSDHSYGSF